MVLALLAGALAAPAPPSWFAAGVGDEWLRLAPVTVSALGVHRAVINTPLGRFVLDDRTGFVARVPDASTAADWARLLGPGPHNFDVNEPRWRGEGYDPALLWWWSEQFASRATLDPHAPHATSLTDPPPPVAEGQRRVVRERLVTMAEVPSDSRSSDGPTLVDTSALLRLGLGPALGVVLGDGVFGRRAPHILVRPSALSKFDVASLPSGCRDPIAETFAGLATLRCEGDPAAPLYVRSGKHWVLEARGVAAPGGGSVAEDGTVLLRGVGGAWVRPPTEAGRGRWWFAAGAPTAWRAGPAGTALAVQQGADSFTVRRIAADGAVGEQHRPLPTGGGWERLYDVQSLREHVFLVHMEEPLNFEAPPRAWVGEALW